jgi:hypothetical protein
MTSYKDHLDGTALSNPWHFEVDIHLVEAGSLDQIYMILPDGFTTYPLDNEGDNWGYGSWPTSYPTLTALQAIYPTGLYTFDFRDSSDLLIKSVQMDFSGISEPISPVDFTYPSVNGQTGISTNPTFNWTVDPGAGDGLSMSVIDDYEEIYSDAPVPMETLSWQPGLLESQHNYWFEVSVFMIKDPQYGPGGLVLPTMTVDGDIFEYGLAVDYCNEINFFTGAVSDHVLEIMMSSTYNYDFPGVPLHYEFDVEIEVDVTVVSGIMRRPDGTEYPMTYENDGVEVWLTFDRDISDPITWDGFGAGTYTFTVNYASGFDSTSVDYQLPGGDPIPYVTQEPQFVYPLHDTVNVPLECTFHFDPATNPDHTIDIWIEPVDGPGLSYNVMVLPHDTSSYGPVTLSPDTLYEGGYTINHFFSFNNADGIPTEIDTDAGTEIHFTTAALSTLSGWVWMESGTDLGYSLNESDLVYFVSSDTVWNLNLATGQWVPDKPAGWIYINWPFYYKLDTGDLWFTLPPVDGLWVYHFSTAQWKVLPRIIP